MRTVRLLGPSLGATYSCLGGERGNVPSSSIPPIPFPADFLTPQTRRIFFAGHALKRAAAAASSVLRMGMWAALAALHLDLLHMGIQVYTGRGPLQQRLQLRAGTTQTCNAIRERIVEHYRATTASSKIQAATSAKLQRGHGLQWRNSTSGHRAAKRKGYGQWNKRTKEKAAQDKAKKTKVTAKERTKLGKT